MLELITSLTVLCISFLWLAAVGMTPMLAVMEKQSDSPTPAWKFRILFTYPAGLFLLLYFLNMQFFWTNPLYWLVGSLGWGLLTMNMWGLPVKKDGATTPR